MTTDLNYTNDGFMVCFMPNTQDGQNAWNVMAKESDDAYFPVHQLPSILLQLKTAGYTVRKASKRNINDDEILAELGA